MRDILFPPSLPQEVLARSFRDRDGEVGVQVEDAATFLDACDEDRVEVLGWDLWLVDHSWDTATNGPRKVPVPGYWCELIPGVGSDLPGIYVGAGDADQCRADIAKIDFNSGDLIPWRNYLRFRFALAQI